MTSLQLCTVASREYLPFVRVLADSVARHHPGTRLKVLWCYDLDHEIGATGESFDSLWNEDLGIDDPELHRLYLMHGRSFMPVVKPYFLEHVVRSTGEPTLLIDSDIGIYASLEDLGEVIAEKGVLLSPHSLAPYPMDGRLPSDTMILSAGMFNAGFIGVGPRGLGMLEFLKSRLRRECVINHAAMRLNEQRWLDFVPSYFDTHLLKDPGVNAAYWNLHDRALEEVDGAVRAGGSPLRAFHFSGYDLARPDLLTCYDGGDGRISLDGQPVLRRLCAGYRDAVVAAGWQPVEATKIFDTLPGGIPVDQLLRDTYRVAVIAAEERRIVLPPDAYDLAERSLFLAWVTLAYQHLGIAAPEWAGGGTLRAPARRGEEASAAPPAPAGGAAAETAQPRPVSPSHDDSAPDPVVTDMVRRLAASTSAALANLDRRVNDLEARAREERVVGV